MISNSSSENTRNVEKISILKANEVFYPLQSVLQKRNIVFDHRSALTIKVLPEDLRYPSTTKMTDSGQTSTYKISLTITDQENHTEEQIKERINQKVILVLHYLNGGLCVIGCNENPLTFVFEDENSSTPAQNHGYNIEMVGITYFTKVNL